jgi:hypothetical protein
MTGDAAQRIGVMVADLLGDLQAEYGDDFQVLDAVIAVEVLPSNPDDAEGWGSIIEHRSTTHRTTVAVGIAELLRESLTAGYERAEDDDEESHD